MMTPEDLPDKYNQIRVLALAAQEMLNWEHSEEERKIYSEFLFNRIRALTLLEVEEVMLLMLVKINHLVDMCAKTTGTQESDIWNLFSNTKEGK